MKRSRKRHRKQHERPDASKYVGQTFGLVTVLRRDGFKLWCRCECGAMRHFDPGNLVSHPPKTHVHCNVNFQYELPLDYVRQMPYKSAS